MRNSPTISDRSAIETSPIISEIGVPCKHERGVDLDSVVERLVFRSQLVFNQSWEDPAVDQQALGLTADDTLVTIASAGDNVLALALAGPKIYAIDLNQVQIHLLRLKVVAAQHIQYSDFWHLFSLAPAERAHDIYHGAVRAHMDADGRAFWDDNLGLLRNGLYREGLFGRTLWMLRTYLRIVCGRQALERFFTCRSLSEQAAFYRERIHPRWWNPIARPFVGQMPLLLLFGVHPCQARRVRRQAFADQLAWRIAHVLTTIPARDNYFWQQVFLGRYLLPPPYLRPEEFRRLKQTVARVELCTGRLEDLLRDLPPATISCFNLLDAPDWLSSEKTAEWWTRIRRAAVPGARVLFRTIDPSYRLPDSVLAHWEDRSQPTWTSSERTGAYWRVNLYVLRPTTG
jgi:S-adenosylmethionine-diacylglycerol 3-amino-3-carboxypropyl transferase